MSLWLQDRMLMVSKVAVVDLNQDAAGSLGQAHYTKEQITCTHF